MITKSVINMAITFTSICSLSSYSTTTSYLYFNRPLVNTYYNVKAQGTSEVTNTILNMFKFTIPLHNVPHQSLQSHCVYISFNSLPPFFVYDQHLKCENTKRYSSLVTLCQMVLSDSSPAKMPLEEKLATYASSVHQHYNRLAYFLLHKYSLIIHTGVLPDPS